MGVLRFRRVQHFLESALAFGKPLHALGVDGGLNLAQHDRALLHDDALQKHVVGLVEEAGLLGNHAEQRRDQPRVRRAAALGLGREQEDQKHIQDGAKDLALEQGDERGVDLAAKVSVRLMVLPVLQQKGFDLLRVAPRLVGRLQIFLGDGVEQQARLVVLGQVARVQDAHQLLGTGRLLRAQWARALLSFSKASFRALKVASMEAATRSVADCRLATLL